jgi:diguanylate cyclase (GGDEF)-like protein/PAS domain S-box-containing protein
MTRAKAALVQAIEAGELAVAYMPIVSLATGEQIGSEALVRWPKATSPEISVEEMITMAEEEGLVGRIDSFVMSQALEDFAAGRLGGKEVSVNLSPAGLEADLPQRIRHGLDRLGLGPEVLMIEITERVILGGNEDLLDVMRQLSEMGVQLAIDDFGAGVTSISDLQRLPFDRVKIDRALTRDVGHEGHERAGKVVGAVVSLAAALDAETVAEGVEDEVQRDALAALGVDNGQGYLFGRAAPIGFRPPGQEEGEPLEAVDRAILDDLTATFFEQTSDLACIDSGGRLLKVNSNFTKVLGWTEEEVLAGSFLDFVHPEDRERTAETLAFTRPDKPLEGFENRLMTTEGSYRRIVWSARVDPSTGLILANGRDVTEEREVEVSRDRLREIVTALSEIEQDYILEGATLGWWRRTLSRILDISDSPYGFFGTVSRDGDGDPYLTIRAFSDIAWNEWSREIYDQFLEAGGLEFRNMETLFGRSVTTGERLISEDVTTDPRGSGFPEGHPRLAAYAGIPLKDSGEVVGMVGLANRDGGYTGEFLEQLDVVFGPLADILAKDSVTSRLERLEEVSLATVRTAERILACDRFEDALGTSREICAEIMPGSTAEFFSIADGGGRLEPFQPESGMTGFDRSECLGMARGEPHLSDRRREPEDRCRHLPEGESATCLPVESQGEEFGLLVVTQPDGAAAGEPAGSALDLLSRLRAVSGALAQVAQRDELVHQSLTDRLTGLPNRDAFIRSVHRSLGQIAETGTPFGVLMLDLDHFKPVNDDLGHRAGDRLLGEVGQVIRSTLRQDDEVCRFGGDEYGVLIATGDRQLLIEAGDRIRNAIGAMEIEGGHRITASLGGVLVTGPETTWEAIYEVMDGKLYEVKHTGRDRVEVAEAVLGD